MKPSCVGEKAASEDGSSSMELEQTRTRLLECQKENDKLREALQSRNGVDVSSLLRQVRRVAINVSSEHFGDLIFRNIQGALSYSVQPSSNSELMINNLIISCMLRGCLKNGCRRLASTTQNYDHYVDLQISF